MVVHRSLDRPQHVLAIAVSAHQRVAGGDRMSGPPGVTQVARDLWRAQREGPAGILRRQARRLSRTVAYARDHSRFYQQLYAGLPADGFVLEDLPPTSKPLLMGAFDDWVSDAGISRAGVEAFIADTERIGMPYREGLFVCETSGTTGHGGLFVHDRRAVSVYQAITIVRVDLAHMSVAGWLDAWRRGFRWAAVLGTGAHFGGAGWVQFLRRTGAPWSGGFRVFSVQQPVSELVSALDAFDPAIVSGYPSAMELLADEQAAGHLHLRPAFVTTAGETMPPEGRARLEEVFRTTAIDAYGASEFEIIAVGCRYDWLHVNEDWVVLEPVDEACHAVPAGQASHSVLLTNLADRVQPIIRYDLGDSVQVRSAPCPCGSPLRPIRVAGRRDDLLSMADADGRPVVLLPLAISAVIEQARGIRRSQVIQTDPSTLRIRLEPERGIDPDALWRAIQRNLGAYLSSHGLSQVELVRATELPQADQRSGKFRQVIAGSHDGG